MSSAKSPLPIARQENAQHSPRGGTVFVFRSKRADRLKLLYWDGTGLVMVQGHHTVTDRRPGEQRADFFRADGYVEESILPRPANRDFGRGRRKLLRNA
jgi:transposase